MSVNASDKPHRIFLGIGGNLAPDGYDGPREGAMAALAAARSDPARYPSLAAATFAVVAGAPLPPEEWWRDAGYPKSSLAVPARA